MCEETAQRRKKKPSDFIACAGYVIITYKSIEKKMQITKVILLEYQATDVVKCVVMMLYLFFFFGQNLQVFGQMYNTRNTATGKNLNSDKELDKVSGL